MRSMVEGGGCWLSELPMQPQRENIHRPALGVVSRIVDELVVGTEGGKTECRQAVVPLENLLRSRLGKLSVAHQDPHPVPFTATPIEPDALMSVKS